MKKDDINKHELNSVITLGKKILNLTYIIMVVGIVLGIVILCRELKVMPIIMDLLGVLSSFFIGFVFAWLFRPLVKRMNKKLPNLASCLIVFLTVVLLIVLFVYVFIPIVYQEVNELAGKVPGIVETTGDGIKDFISNIDMDGLNLDDVADDTMDSMKVYVTDFTRSLPNTIIDILLSLFSGIGTFVMGLIIGLYMLIDYESIGKHFKKLIPPKHRKEVTDLFIRLGSEARKCVNGTLTVAFMVFLCDSFGFALIGLDAPILFGLFCGITDLIPYIGPYIGGAAAVVVGFTSNTFVGVATIIICIIVQLLENYVLQPVVMSKASNLHPVAIIIGLLVFGHFFGIIGMILATPCIAMMKVLFDFGFTKAKNYKK